MQWDDWLKDTEVPEEPENAIPEKKKSFVNPFAADLWNGVVTAGQDVVNTVGATAAKLANSASGVNGELERDLEGYDLPQEQQKAVNAGEAIANQKTNDFWSGIENSMTDTAKAMDSHKYDQSDYSFTPTSTAGKFSSAVLQNLAPMAMQGAAAAVNPALGLAVAGSQIAGDAYGDLRSKGVNPNTAANAAMLDALAQAPFEHLGGVNKWFKARNILANHGLLKAVGKSVAEEGVTEAIQEVPDELIRYYTEKGTLDGFDLKQLGLNAAEAGAVGGFYGGLFGAAGHFAGKKNADTKQNTNQSEQTATETTQNEPVQEATAQENTVQEAQAINPNVKPFATNDDEGDKPQYTRETAPNTAMYAMSRLINAGIDKQTAAGIVGGFMTESGGNTFDIDPHAENPNGGAYGIAQWLDRKDGLTNFASERGLDPTDIDTQIDFAIHELNGSENEALNKIKTAQSPEEAGILADQWYERSEGTDDIRNAKSANARAIFDAYNGNETPGRMTADVPKLKTAEDYLKEMYDTMPLNTEEDQHLNDDLDRLLRSGSKEEIEKKAEELGYKKPQAQEAQKEAEEQDNSNPFIAVQSAPVAQTMVQKPGTQANDPTVNLNPIQTAKNTLKQPNKPIQTTEQVSTPKPRENAPQVSNQPKMDSFPNTEGAAIPKSVIQESQQIQQEAQDRDSNLEPTMRYDEKTKEFVPVKKNPRQSVEQIDFNKPWNRVISDNDVNNPHYVNMSKLNGRINDALKNHVLMGLARKAYLHGDKTSLDLIQHAHPGVLKAVKETVTGTPEVSEATNKVSSETSNSVSNNLGGTTNENTEINQRNSGTETDNNQDVNAEPEQAGNKESRTRKSTKKKKDLAGFNPGDKVRIKGDDEVFTVKRKGKISYTVTDSEGNDMPVSANMVEAAEDSEAKKEDKANPVADSVNSKEGMAEDAETEKVDTDVTEKQNVTPPKQKTSSTIAKSDRSKDTKPEVNANTIVLGKHGIKVKSEHAEEANTYALFIVNQVNEAIDTYNCKTVTSEKIVKFLHNLKLYYGKGRLTDSRSENHTVAKFSSSIINKAEAEISKKNPGEVPMFTFGKDFFGVPVGDTVVEDVQTALASKFIEEKAKKTDPVTATIAKTPWMDEAAASRFPRAWKYQDIGNGLAMVTTTVEHVRDKDLLVVKAEKELAERQKAEEQLKQEEEAAEKEARKNAYNGFVADKPPISAQRIIDTLDTKERYDGKVKTRGQFIEDIVKEHPDAKLYSERKVRYDDKGKHESRFPSWYLAPDTGENISYEITKTEADYFKFLKENKVFDEAKSDVSAKDEIPENSKLTSNKSDEEDYHGFLETFSNPDRVEMVKKALEVKINPFDPMTKGFTSLKHISELYAKQPDLKVSFHDGKYYVGGHKISQIMYLYIKYLRANGIMGVENTEAVRQKEEANGDGSGSISKPVEMARPGESKGAGSKRAESGSTGAGKTGSGRKESSGRTGGNEPAGTGEHKESGRTGNGNEAERNDSAGTGKRGAEVSVSDTKVSAPAKESEAAKKTEKVEADIKKGKMKNANDIAGHDYTVKPIEKRSIRQRIDDNVNAVKLLNKIESEHRKATPSEQEILARYSGWGGLTNAFDSSKPEYSGELKEILSEEDYKKCKAETVDAYYTPPYVINSMWKIAERLGFKGGRVLDPSTGTANFFGLMPASMRSRSKLNGVELSAIPARIAGQLYQSAKIINDGFENFKGRDGYYDMAITNVPFGDTVLSEDGIGKYNIHNYFFAKSLDKVRPGGLVMFVTSNDTMDGGGYGERLRILLNRKAELVGALRLPTSTFSDTGAKVTTDIIVMRKLNDNEKAGTAWNNMSYVWDKNVHGMEYNISGTHNAYFDEHPEHVIGTPGYVHGRYGNTAGIVLDKDVQAERLIDKAIEDFPKDIYSPAKTTPHNTPAKVEELEKAATGKNIGDIVNNNGVYGRVVVQKDGSVTVKEYPKTNQQTVKDFLQVQDALNDLSKAEVTDDVTDKELDGKRKALNDAYNAFVKKHGNLTAEKNFKLLSDTSMVGRVMALENEKKDDVTGKKYIEKADIFTKRVALPAKKKVHASTASDALLSSLQELGYVDIDYMANELGRTPEDVAADLSGRIIKDPVSERYVTRDEYLSGNVRQKLEEAKTAVKFDPAYEENVRELEKVIPKDLTENDVYIEPGSSEMSDEDITEFVNSIIPVRYGLRVRYSPILGTWAVTINDGWNGVRYKDSAQFRNVTYGTEHMPFEKILDCVLNGKQVTTAVLKVSANDSPEVRDAKEKEQEQALALADKLKEDFQKWLWTDKERKERILKSYNNKFNAERLREYDGSFLELPWYSATAPRLLKHQKDAVWRALNQKSTLLAHVVGSGKTWTVQSLIMELRRLGMAKKIVLTVPNNVVRQSEKEFYQIAPNAKILVLDSKSLPSAPPSLTHKYVAETEIVTDKNGREKKQNKLDAAGHIIYKKVPLTEDEKAKAHYKAAARDAALQKIKTNDWDAIIMSHETFERIPVSNETLGQFYQKQIDDYVAALEAQKLERGKDSKSTIRDIEKKIKGYKAKLYSLTEGKDKYELGADTFESLGIDQLIVDEADLFKNLEIQTSLGNVKGISDTHSGRAEDMFLKTQYLMGNPACHGVVFATGTPISNSVTELYTMCRYLSNSDLEKLGISGFDQFARRFIRIGQGTVPKQDGSGMELKIMVRGLNNAPDIIRIFRKFTDVKTIEDLPEVEAKRPKAEYEAVECAESKWMHDYRTKVIKDRAAAIKSGSVDRHVDNMLLLANDFKNATLDPRIVSNIVPEEEANAKVKALAEKVVKEYHDSADIRGAQIIFCDLSTPSDANKKRGKVSEYQRVKDELVKHGIPADEIRFIQEAKNDVEKQKIFEQVNDGSIRVLIGSTTMMGAGTNMQKRLVALHHLDCPWRPRDIEQREGRILRQGNMNKSVRIYNYVAKGSYDMNLWNLVKNKAFIINQVMHGDLSHRTMDMDEEADANYEKLEALSNNDPNQKKLIEVSRDIRRLSAMKSSFEHGMKQRASVISDSPAMIESVKADLKHIEEDIQKRDKTSKEFAITINGTKYDKEGKANEAMAEAKAEAALFYKRQMQAQGEYQADLKDQKVGTVRGFDVYVSPNVIFRRGGNAESLDIVVKGGHTYTANTPTARGAWNIINNQPEAVREAQKNNIESLSANLAEAQKHEHDIFEHEGELNNLIKEKKCLEDVIQNQSESDNVKDAGEEVGTHYLATNPNAHAEDKVKVTSLDGVMPINPSKKTQREDFFRAVNGLPIVFNGGTGKIEIIDKKAYPGENKRVGDELLYGHNKKQIYNPVRKRILSKLQEVINNSVFIEKHNDIAHGFPTKYIEAFAAISFNGKISRIRITLRERGDEESYSKVGNAIPYNVRVDGILKDEPAPKAPSQSEVSSVETSQGEAPLISATDSSDTISIAQLMENARDRNGSNYMVDGVLQFEPDVKVSIPTAEKAQKGNIEKQETQPENHESISEEPTIHHSNEELKKQVLSAFPNAKNIEETENGVAFNFPNSNYRVEANITDGNIAIDWDSAQRDYHGTLKGTEKAQGGIKVYARKAIMTLSVNSVDQTPTHEAFHLAWDLFLNDRERKAVEIKHRSVEEAAEAMRKWKIARSKGQGTILGKVWQKISDYAHMLESIFVENEHNVFRKIAEGRMWKREADNAAAARLHYSLSPAESMKKFAKAHLFMYSQKPLSDDPDIKVQERKYGNGKGFGVLEALRTNVFSTSRSKDATVKVLHRLGDDAMRTVTNLSSKWGHAHADDVISHLKTKEDIKAYDALMVESDIEHHEYTAEELREKGIPENVAKAYSGVRKILDDVYAKVNEVYTQTHIETRTVRTEAEAKAIGKRPFTEVIRIDKRATSTGAFYTVSFRTPSYSSRLIENVSPEELAELKKDDHTYIQKQETDDAGNVNLTVLEYAKPLEHLEGYMPHLFHGWMIIEKDPTGNARVVGSATTAEKAVAKAKELKQANMTYEITPKSMNFDGIESTTVLGDIDYNHLRDSLAANLTLSLEEADALLDAKKSNKHVFFEALKNRTGADGYEQNARWVVQHYIDSAARYCGLDPFKYKSMSLFERTFGAFGDEYVKGGKADFVKGYINSMLGKPGLLENAVNALLHKLPITRNMARPGKQISGTVMGLVSVLKLGASPAAAFVNMMQLNNAVGYLGYTAVAAGMRHATNLSEQDKAVLSRLGTNDEVGLEDIGDYGKIRLEYTKYGKIADIYHKAGEMAMKPFTAAEHFIRRTTSLAAYYKALGKGMNEKAAIEYARDINRRVNFDYSVADAPRIFRTLSGTIIGDTTLQFQKYGVKQLEVIGDFLPFVGKGTTTKQKLQFFIPYMLIGGLFNALPFQDLLLALFGAITGDKEPEATMKKGIMEWAGDNPGKKAVANVAMYGAASIVGIDISQRVGLKGIIPDNRFGVGGAAYSTTVGLAKAILQGDLGNAFKATMPEASNLYQAARGYGTDMKGRKTVDYDGYDRAMRALGFRTVTEAKAADIQSIVYNYKENRNNARKEAREKYYSDSSGKNIDKLKSLGYTDKQIKALDKAKKKVGEDSTRMSRTKSTLSKKDLKELDELFRAGEK